MTKSIKAFAKAALDFRQPAIIKGGFLLGYHGAISADPSLIDAGVFKVVLRTAIEENHKLSDVRHKASSVIATMLRHRPDLADRVLAQAATDRNLSWGWNESVYEVIRDKRPDLIADSDPEPTAPAKHPVSSSAPTARLP